MPAAAACAALSVAGVLAVVTVSELHPATAASASKPTLNFLLSIEKDMCSPMRSFLFPASVAGLAKVSK
jgi:hypothetical protein